MKVILSKYAGFCYGVDKAIKMADQVFVTKKNKNIYMLGELVHNEEVIEKIKKQNINLVNDIKKIPRNSLVILSAHGHSPAIYQEAKERNLEVVDATCPMVTRVHVLSKMLAGQGYFIVIIGDKKHGEVKAIFDQTKALTDKVGIIENVEQARKIKSLPKIGIVSQTTQSLNDFEEIVAALASKSNELRVFNTICDATRFRQKAAKDLAKKVDLMLIVGSFRSANTKRLTSICSEIIETHQINSVKELDKKWLKGKKIVGVSAGASTPDWIIKEVVREVRRS